MVETTQRDDELEAVVPPPLLRGGNRLAFVVAGVGGLAALAAMIVEGKGLTADFVWLAICTGLAWLGAVFHDRSPSMWTAAVAIAAINSMLSTVTTQPSTAVLIGLLLILVWTAMQLEPKWSALVAIYAGASIWVFGGRYVFTTFEADPGEFAIPALLAILGIPLGLGVTLHSRQRAAEASVAASIARLEHQREVLQTRLQAKIGELDLSREQLFAAQKLKTVGTMASGLAHELNNILTPIRGHAELIAEGSATPEQSRRYGQRILDSAAAAAQITGALLTYTRQGTFQPVRSNLRQLLQSQILPVMSKSMPGNVQFRVDLARNVSVDVDRVLFQQAIANLIFNAVDAMPKGGVISIGLATSIHSPLEADAERERDDIQRSAVITVGDNGSGIPAENLDQIFDPFFTTKAVGSGSGLGLPMVMGTVTRHQGRISVDSSIGRGTTFTIHLPLAPAEERDAHKPWPVLRGEAKGPIVVVLTEDQDALDEYEELLEGTECSPICTADVRSAMPLLTELGDKVDLLILDLDIAVADASRLFKTVRELFPEMPIILVSDQPIDGAIQRLIGAGPTRSVRKPMDNRLFSALLTDLLHPVSGYGHDFTPVPINVGADASGTHPRG